MGIMNLLMGQILRRFQEEHGRGPETKVLLQLRQTLAQRLGVDVPPVEDDNDDEKDQENNHDNNRDLENLPQPRTKTT